MTTNATLAAQHQTIADFGDQWAAFPNNRGYYASPELLADIVQPLMNLEDIRGARVMDIGSGTGRIVNMLVQAGADHVMAVEPSRAFSILQRNVAHHGDRVSLLQARGDEIPADPIFDLVVSVGVLHNVPDPRPIVRACWKALRPGGRLCIWIYGKEGNELYLSVIEPLRRLTRRLPHYLLVALIRLLDPVLLLYMIVCRRLPLPLHTYLNQVLGMFDGPERRLVIYDQLNPCFAKYYTREEAVALLADEGFAEVRAHHRHGYSWTVLGTKR